MTVENKRVLITGGAGFIGSELTRQAAVQCAEVLIVDNLINGRRENIEEVLGDRIRFHETDIRDMDRMRELIAGVDVIFHLACLGVRHSLDHPWENHDVNANATLRLLELARSAGVGRFVYVSSSEVYGTATTVPMTEDHPTYPHTVYGASKLAGECYARAYHRTFKRETVVVRPFNAFGPRSHHEGDSGEVIPKFMLRCLAGWPMIVFGDGTQTRDFTFVSDTARGILLAGSSPAAVGRTINLASGREITVEELAHTVARVIDRSDAGIEHYPPRPGDVLRLCGDASLARELLKFETRVSLRDGLQRLYEWYRASGCSPEKLLEREQARNWKMEVQHADAQTREPDPHHQAGA